MRGPKDEKGDRVDARARMNQNQSFRREHLAMADGTFGWRGLGEVRMMDGNTTADHSALNFTKWSQLSNSNAAASNTSNNLLDN